jgi:hypothetical protein
MQSVFTLSFTTGDITVSSIVPSDNMIFSSNGTYTFTFAPKHTMLSTYVITIILPSELEVQQNSACTLYNPENPLYSCGADAAGNSITIRDFHLDDDHEAETNIVMEIDSIRNPVDYITPGLTIFNITDGKNFGEVDYGEFNAWESGRDLFTYSYI